MSSLDAYRLLGIEPGASPEEIRAAFRAKVRQNHPDTSVGDAGPEVGEIVDAYRVLINRGSRDATNSSERPGGHRVPVRNAGRMKEGDRGRSHRVCEECSGEGSKRQRVLCADCGGRGAVTALDSRSAKVLRCRRCTGRGAIIEETVCAHCDGSGLLSS